MRCLAAMLGLGLSVCLSSASFAATEIRLWHGLVGELSDKLTELTATFNASQEAYRILPIYKGTYPEVMTAAIAAFEVGQQPHIVQIFEVGTGTMMAAKGAIYPVHQLMADTDTAFDPNAYLPAVAGYYTDGGGNMLSMPFNASTPILFYNKTLFTRAGLDPETAPKTWADVEQAAARLQAVGVPCGFTSEWPDWIQIENFSAWHDLPIGTHGNGIGGPDAELTLDDPLQVRHLDNLARWQTTRLFDYGGRYGDAKPKFYSGECGMFLASSASRTGILANTEGAVGAGMLPYYDDVEGAPRTTMIGGASLWVMQGMPEADYGGIAAFFAHLSEPEVQAWWHQETGYLPITEEAYWLSRSQGYYDENPEAEIAIKQITINEPSENSAGLRFGNFPQIREIMLQEMEAAISGQKSAEAALQAVMERGNHLLRRFEAENF